MSENDQNELTTHKLTILLQVMGLFGLAFALGYCGGRL